MPYHPINPTTNAIRPGQSERRKDLQARCCTLVLEKNGVGRIEGDKRISALLRDVAGFKFNPHDRHHFIGGSDARVIMGNDEVRLIHLCREWRGEIEPEDLTGNLIVQFGTIAEFDSLILALVLNSAGISLCPFRGLGHEAQSFTDGRIVGIRKSTKRGSWSPVSAASPMSAMPAHTWGSRIRLL